jgi:hypothetical protein
MTKKDGAGPSSITERIGNTNVEAGVWCLNRL